MVPDAGEGPEADWPGIMVGQVLVGFEGDWIGRRFGLVQDALVMFRECPWDHHLADVSLTHLVGLIMLTASWGTSLNGWVICYAYV